MEALSCCLCEFGAHTESQLEEHIDVRHSDIFRVADNEWKLEILNNAIQRTRPQHLDSKAPQAYQPTPFDANSSIINKQSSPIPYNPSTATMVELPTVTKRRRGRPSLKNDLKSASTVVSSAKEDHDAGDTKSSETSETLLLDAADNRKRKSSMPDEVSERKRTRGFDWGSEGVADVDHLHQLSMLQQEVNSRRNENEKMKQDLYIKDTEFRDLKDTMEKLNIKKCNLELQLDSVVKEKNATDSILAQTKAELNKNHEILMEKQLELTQVRESLIQQQIELNEAKESNTQHQAKLKQVRETFKGLSESLTQKCFELKESKLAEERLQIELTDLQAEHSSAKIKFDECLLTFKNMFEKLRDENQTFREDGERFKKIKELFLAILKKDEKLCKTDPESAKAFDNDDELFEMLKDFIVDTFEEKRMLCNEAFKTQKLIASLNQANAQKNSALTSAQKRLVRLDANQNGLRSELQNFREKAKLEKISDEETIKNLKKELDELDSITTSLMDKANESAKREDKLLATISDLEKSVAVKEQKLEGVEAQKKEIDDLKWELIELEKLAENMKIENEDLVKKEKETSATVFALQRQVEDSAKEINELKLKSVHYQRLQDQEKNSVQLKDKYNLLLQRVKEYMATTESLTGEIAQRNELVKNLENELTLLKSAGLRTDNPIDSQALEKLKFDYEQKLSDLQKELKQKDDVYVETLKSHSTILTKLDQEVAKILSLKDKEIEDLKRRIQETSDNLDKRCELSS